MHVEVPPSTALVMRFGTPYNDTELFLQLAAGSVQYGHGSKILGA